MLLRICLTFFVLIFVKNITGYLAQVAMVYVGESIIRDLRNQLFRRFTELPLGFYHQNKAGELISRATNDVLMAQKCVGVSFTTLVRDPLYILMALAVALIISWKMTLLALLLMPASLVVIIRIGKGLRNISRRQQEEMANLTSTLQEAVYGVRVIKAFAMEDFENRKFIRRSGALFREVFRYNWIMKMSSPLTEQLSTIVGLFLLWYGGSKVFTGGLMAPDLFLVFFFAIFSMVPHQEPGEQRDPAGMAPAHFCRAGHPARYWARAPAWWAGWSCATCISATSRVNRCCGASRCRSNPVRWWPWWAAAAAARAP
jgi:subfamily B ATP-binding cassette protein MsbA